MLNKAQNSLIALLRWSERYTKTDMVYLAHGGFWLGLAQLAASLGAFGLTVALANLLSPEVFGEYRFLMSAFLVLAIFALPGMNTALMESTPRGFRKNIDIAFKEMMRFGFLGAGISLIVSLYYFIKGDVSLFLGFAAIAVALPLFDSSLSHISYLKSLKEFKRVALSTTITRVLMLVAAVSTSIAFPEHAWLILAAFLLGQIIPNLILHKITAISHVQPHDRSDPGIVSYAKHLTAMTVLGLIAVHLDKVLIWHFLGAEELAIFFIAYAIPQEAHRFLQIVPQLAFSKFTTVQPSIIRTTLIPKLWKYFCVILIIALLYVLLCPLIFKFFFPQYTEAVLYSQVLVFSILSAAFGPIRTYLTVAKAKRALYFLFTFIPSTRIALLIIFVAQFGIWGAIIALLVETLLQIILLQYLLFSATYGK